MVRRTRSRVSLPRNELHASKSRQSWTACALLSLLNAHECNIEHMQLPGTIATVLGLSGKVTATSADFVSYDTCERPIFLAPSHTAILLPSFALISWWYQIISRTVPSSTARFKNLSFRFHSRVGRPKPCHNAQKVGHLLQLDMVLVACSGKIIMVAPMTL